jgi:hypothetical protein
MDIRDKGLLFQPLSLSPLLTAEDPPLYPNLLTPRGKT